MTIRKFSAFMCAFAIVALVVGLIGCEKAMDIMPPGDKAPEGITIGVAVAETGGNAEPYVLPMLRGLELAQEQLNLQGANIMFVREDNMSTIDGAKAAVQALVDQGVPAIIGVGISSQLEEAFPIAQAAGVVAFSPISSAAGLSGEVGDYAFRAGIATNILVPGGVKKTHAQLNYSNVAVIFDEEDRYSVSIKDELKKALDANNINIVTEQPFKKEQTDYSMQLDSIKSMNIDVLFIAALSTQMIEIIQEARGMDGISSDIKLIAPDLTGSEVAALGPAAEGAIAFAGWSSVSDTPGNQDFVQAYMAKYEGKAPEPWAAQAYATLYILANAINEAQSSDSAAIRDALAKTSHFPTILGPFSFDPKGEAIYENIEVIVQTVVDGKLQDQ